MKRVKNFFNSIYIKFILIFLLILNFTSFLSFGIITYTRLNELKDFTEIIENLQYQRAFFLKVTEILRENMMLTMVISSIFSTVTLYIILRPIKRVSKATQEVSKGNFDTQVKTKAKGEIGELAKNFNIMAKGLKNNEYLHKDFVSSVSHEVKTPITAISGFAKLLKDDNLTKEQKDEYVDIIVSESNRLTNLSTNLLKLSELDSKVIYKKDEFSLDEQIRRIILLLQNKWEQKNIKINVDLEKVTFVGDKELFEIVWINLIGNSVKFTPEEGEIFIKLKNEDNNIVVSIQDTGIGIDDKDKEFIFERFYIADKSRNKDSTGLGLSIVKRIITLAEGEISVESTKDIGTTFYIKLERRD